MKQQRISSEKGQVLVLLVLAIVALVGFLALAVDGGNMYSARRTAQNAADASALAGAAQVAKAVKGVTNVNWSCSQLATKYTNWSVAKQAAVNQATQNGFTIAADQATNTVQVICGPDGNKVVDVFVEITQPVQTAFMQVLGLSQPVNTVQATVRVQPRIVYGNGATIVATRDSCDNVPGPSDGGFTVNGDTNIKITGGGIISNDCCRVDGNSTIVNITGGSWTCDGVIDLNPKDTSKPNSQNLIPGPVDGPDAPVDAAPLDAKLSAGCDTLTNGSTTTDVRAKNSKTVNLTAGKYRNLDVDAGGTLNLGAGLYCIYGAVNVNGVLNGTGVTLYMPDLGSNKVSFTTSGGSSVNLSAPPIDCDYDTPGCKPAIGGLLILYMPKDETNGTTPIFKLSGNSTSNFEGTIMVPNTAALIEGNSAISPCSPTKNRMQLIAETVVFSGTGDICVNYDPDYTLNLPALMNLQK